MLTRGAIDPVHALAMAGAMAALAALACLDYPRAAVLLAGMSGVFEGAAYGLLAVRAQRRPALWRPTRDGVGLDAAQLLATLALVVAQGAQARVVFAALALIAAGARIEDGYQRGDR